MPPIGTPTVEREDKVAVAKPRHAGDDRLRARRERDERVAFRLAARGRDQPRRRDRSARPAHADGLAAATSRQKNEADELRQRRLPPAAACQTRRSSSIVNTRVRAPSLLRLPRTTGGR